MTLSNLIHGRDNNFNLIRILAAFSVLITHCFTLTAGSAKAEPFRDTLGMSLGDIAVDVFFIISGFLVTISLLTKQNMLEFIWARVLRIYPALWVMLLLTVFGLGAVMTTLSLPAYFTSAQTYGYWLKCATLFTGVVFQLPGVFDSNPYSHSVNGALWTLPSEIHLYSILALLWVGLRVIKTQHIKLFEQVIVGIFIMATLSLLMRVFMMDTDAVFNKRAFMFFSGASVYILRAYITLSRSVLGVLIAALCLSILIGQKTFLLTYFLTLTYIVFYAAYVPTGVVRQYNQEGDYSYGLYIYGFPIQQTLEAFNPKMGALSMFVMSAPIALLAAALSWHFVEQRALILKTACIAYTRRLLAF